MHVRSQRCLIKHCREENKAWYWDAAHSWRLCPLSGGGHKQEGCHLLCHTLRVDSSESHFHGSAKWQWGDLGKVPFLYQITVFHSYFPFLHLSLFKLFKLRSNNSVTVIPRGTNTPCTCRCTQLFTQVWGIQVSMHSKYIASWAMSPSQDCIFVFGQRTEKALDIES